MKIYQSFSSEKTKEIGNLLAQKIINSRVAKPQTRNAVMLALQGELGAGKTTFTQGFFQGLGIKRRAVSPTFVIMRRYKIPAGTKQGTDRLTNVYHMDAYRLKKAEDLAVLEFDAILSNPKNLVLIEWPERIKEILPKNAIWLKFQHGEKENERKIQIK